MLKEIRSTNENPILNYEIVDTDFTFKYKFKFGFNVKINNNNQYYEELIDVFVKAYEINNCDVVSNLLIWYENYFGRDEWKFEFRKHLKAQYPNYYNRFQKLLILQ
jgi:hypothetical protein